MKKILVTGHNGFIGSHLVKLLSKKYEIIGVSSKQTKEKITQIKKNIVNYDGNDLPKKIDVIIHLAALTDLVYCQNNPTECYDVNVKGTQNMLEIARKHKSKFIYLSTSHVYGKPKKLPIKEDHPLNPTSIYASSKLAGENIVESYGKNYDMDVSTLRLFSVYGINSPQYLVTSKIISQLSTKNTISLGNVTPKRDFIYIDDVIHAIEIVLKKSHGFNVYNVGTGRSHSILEICKNLKKISGKNPPLKSLSSLSRKNDVPNVVSNSNKLKKLGWKPTISLFDGLLLTWNYSSTLNS